MDHRMYHSPLPLNCAKFIYAIFSYNTLKKKKSIGVCTISRMQYTWPRLGI